MKNSIGTLSIKLVTDANGMVTGFELAKKKTQQFERSVGGSSNRLAALGKQAIMTSGALGRMGGLTTGIAGLAGPIGLVAAAFIGLGVAISRSAIASQDMQIERLRELGRISPDIKTTSEAFGDLREQFGLFAQLLSEGSGAGEGLRMFLQGMKANARELNSKLLFGEEAVAAAEKKRALVRDDELLKLKRRADELKKTLRTPGEQFGDTIGELLKMREEGFLSHETLMRGASKASEEYRRLTESVRGARSEMAGIPALEMGTAGARTALLRSGSGAAGGRDSPRVLAEIAATMKRIEGYEKELAKKGGITLKKAEL